MRAAVGLLICLATLSGPQALCGPRVLADDAHPPVLVPRVGPVPAYEGPMLRLAELVGELHYLRGLCAAPEASAWRDRMGDLLAGEAADEGRRLALTAAFNKGYASVRPRYSRCDAAAKAMTRAALDEGRRLAGTLVSEAGG